MARRANPTVIGAFAVGAVVLAVGAVFLFGSGRFFSDTQKYVLFFDESLKGLSIGSPVTLAGVEIGSVTDIQVELDLEEMSYRAPVTIEIDRHTFARVRRGKSMEERVRLDARRVGQLVEEGLRAQLQTRSYLTGMLQVALEFRPDTEARLEGVRGKYPEIPTIPTALEQLSRTLESLPVEELVDRLNQLVQGMDEMLRSPRMGENLSSLEQTLQNVLILTEDLSNGDDGVVTHLQEAIAEIREVVDNVNLQVESLCSATLAAVERAQKVLKDADEDTVPQLNALLERAGGQIDPLAARLTAAIASAETTLDAATKVLDDVGRATAGAPDAGQELEAVLRELNSAARAVRELADYLDRHPESLLLGKEGN